MADKSPKKKPEQPQRSKKANANSNILKRPKGMSKAVFRELAKWMSEDKKKERNSE